MAPTSSILLWDLNRVGGEHLPTVGLFFFQKCDKLLFHIEQQSYIFQFKKLLSDDPLKMSAQS